ncbi:MAG TPA: hypothetical protein VMT19_10420 [Thermoanaerobaculaceae bacterium]|nr:hypothetical protein [Thermoanaerobaculaceae bacterium]
MTIEKRGEGKNCGSAWLRVAVGVVAVLLLASVAGAQVTGLYYQEVAKDGRIYVFNTYERYQAFQKSGEMGTGITLIGRGPNGETVVAENETAVDLFLFKHNLPAYDRPAPKPPAPASAFPKTTIGGRVYADLSSKENKDDATGVKTSDSGVGIDVKRFYFTVTHDFDSMWSAQFQSDIGDAGAKRYDVFVKKAFIQLKLDNAAIFRLGSADTPWVPFVEGIYGQRYLENILVDELSFGTSADWGLHFLGKAADNMLSYQFSLLNGKGYSNPTRTKSVDFEGRVALEPVSGLTFAVGGYSGKRGNDTDATPAKHTANRFDALANWNVGPVKIGGEYFTADNWNQTAKTPTDKSDGYSGWLQFAVDKEWTLFGRYDTADPSKDLNAALKYKYYNLGVQWKPVKSTVATLAYKYADVAGGTLSTSNGTIGSTKAGFKGKYNEVGFWFSYDF